MLETDKEVINISYTLDSKVCSILFNRENIIGPPSCAKSNAGNVHITILRILNRLFLGGTKT